MNYCLHITAAPYTSQGAMSALCFAQAAMKRGHNISRVFFSGEGVLNGNALATPPQDEVNLCTAWHEFAKTHHSELILCITSALKHGVINHEEAERYEKPAANLQDGFAISGLGQLVESCLIADRVIRFL